MNTIEANQTYMSCANDGFARSMDRNTGHFGTKTLRH